MKRAPVPVTNSCREDSPDGVGVSADSVKQERETTPRSLSFLKTPAPGFPAICVGLY